MNSAVRAAAAADFLAGGGELGALVRAHDWAGTSLGPLEDWPQSLKTAAGIILRTPVPMVLLWGEDGIMIYNDAYSGFAGGRHPGLLGSKVREGWPEVADFNDRVMKAVLAGETLHFRDQELTLHRYGQPDQVWMNLDYSPVVDESGKPAGVLAVVIETTERVAAERRQQAAEAALRIERDRARGVLEKMTEGFILLDHDFRVVDVNPEGLRLEQCSRDMIIGKTHWEAWPGTEMSEIGRLYKRAMGERVPVSLEHRYVWEDGHDAWIDMRAYPTDDGLAIFFRDITERKRAEDALHESRAYLRLLLDSTSEAFYAVDPGGTTTLCNPAFIKMLGFAQKSDALGRKLHEIIHHSHPDGSHYADEECPIYVCARTGQPAHITDELFYRLDGTSFPVEYRASPILRNGELAGAICTFVDVTERDKSENALRETSRRLSAILNNTEMAVFLMDHRQYCVYANAAAETLTGYTFAEMQGRPLHDVVHHKYPDGRHYPLEECPIDRAFPERSKMQGEEVFVHRNGSFYPVAFTASPVLDDDAKPVGTVIEVRNIAQEKAREQALLQSNALLSAVMEAVPGVVYAKDREGRVIAANRGTVELVGKPLADIVGRTDLEFLDEAEARAVMANDRRIMTADRTETVEEAVSGPKGERLVWWSTKAPLHDESGEVVGVVGASVDITDRKRAEERLQEETRTLETLNRTGAALAGELDLERVVQRVTDAGVELTGAQFGAFFYNVLSAEGESYMLYTLSGVDRAHFENFPMPRATEVFQPTFKGEGVIRSDDILTDLRYGKSDPHRGMPKGHLPVRSYLAVPVTSRSGEVIGGLLFGHKQPGVFTKRHEEILVGIAGQAAVAVDNARLFQTIQRLNDTLESRVQERTAERDRIWRLSQDMLGVADFKGRWVSVNPAWRRILGWDEAEIVGRTSEWLEHPEDRDRTRAEVSRLANGGKTLAFENRFRHRDGSYHWLSWTAVPEEGLLYCVARDISAEKEQAETLRQTEEALRQAQKMEAVGQLTGGIAHDFNNLLTGVIGSLDMMQRRITQGRTENIERYATAAMSSANRAAALTHRLLAFSRRQPLDPKPVNANRLVTGMEELLRRTIGEAISLEIVTAGGLWLTRCDPHQLESAILNLAINGRDAMPNGGTLTIETCNAHLDSAYAAHQREVRPGQYVCICVTDTGTGMSPDVLAKAFEPFFTTKPIGQGTGLGLSMIYGFARQSEGYAKIYSELGKGTTVKLYLPRYYGEAEHAAEEQTGLSEAHRAEHGEVVVVVEDETAVRDLVTDVLQELGYRAVEASDGPAGLKVLQSETRVDLLITDVGLPGLNGRQVADAARQERPDLKVLFMTGYAENAAIANGFLEPGMQMITKPFAIEALVSRIRDMIEGERHGHPQELRC